MPILIKVVNKVKKEDLRILKLAEFLIDFLGDDFVSLEAVDLPDGSNVRIVLRRLDDDVIDKALEAIKKAEAEIGEPGIFIPDLVSIDEIRFMRADERYDEIPKEKLEKLRKTLIDFLGDDFVSLEAVDLPDGSNVRIVLRRLDDDVIDKALEAIKKAEAEIGEPGIFIPDLVSIDELERLFEES